MKHQVERLRGSLLCVNDLIAVATQKDKKTSSPKYRRSSYFNYEYVKGIISKIRETGNEAHLVHKDKDYVCPLIFADIYFKVFGTSEIEEEWIIDNILSSNTISPSIAQNAYMVLEKVSGSYYNFKICKSKLDELIMSSTGTSSVEESLEKNWNYTNHILELFVKYAYSFNSAEYTINFIKHLIVK